MWIARYLYLVCWQAQPFHDPLHQWLPPLDASVEQDQELASAPVVADSASGALLVFGLRNTPGCHQLRPIIHVVFPVDFPFPVIVRVTQRRGFDEQLAA